MDARLTGRRCSRGVRGRSARRSGKRSPPRRFACPCRSLRRSRCGASTGNVLIPLLTTEEPDATATAFTVVMSVVSIGSVSGTLWLARRRPVTIHAIALSCICFGVANAALALSPTTFVAAAASAAVGATAMVLFNASVIGMQMSSEPGMRGRIMGIFSMVFIGSYGIGGPIAGAVAEHLGARAAIGLGSITALVVGGAVLVSRVAHADPGDHAATAKGKGLADAVA